MKTYEPMTPQEFISEHGLNEWKASLEYWPLHGYYIPEEWLSGFSRWTVCTGSQCEYYDEETNRCPTDPNTGRCPKDKPHLLLDYAPEYSHGFLKKKVLSKCAGGWIRHLTAVPGLENWHKAVNEGREEAGLDLIPLDPSVQIRTDAGWNVCSTETVFTLDELGRPVPSHSIKSPFKGVPILTQPPPRIAHAPLHLLKPGHAPDENSTNVSQLPINVKDFPGQFKISWRHTHEGLDRNVEWTHPETGEIQIFNLLEEHLRAHHNNEPHQVDDPHRHSFLLLLNDMTAHRNKHTESVYVLLSDRPEGFNQWVPMDHHGVEPYEVHRSADPGKYLMLPSRRTSGEPYLHSHDKCPAALLFQELTDNGTITPEIKDALFSECKKHQKSHKDPITGFVNPGFRCSWGKDESWETAHQDSSHRFGARKCGEPILVKEQCNAPTQRRVRNKETGEMETKYGVCKRYVNPDTPCPVKGPDKTPHGTEHSNSTRPCDASWPCRVHTGPVSNYDPRRFDWESMKGEPAYISSTNVQITLSDGSTQNFHLPPATLLIHAHQSVDQKDLRYPNPAERFHCPLLTRDKFLGRGKPGDPDYVKKASTVFIIAEAAHKAGAAAAYIHKHGLDATVISVASVTLFSNCPEFGYKNPVTGEEIPDVISPLLAGRNVIIVGDNDGLGGNPNVIASLEGFRQKLINSEFPAKEVLLVAPPHEGYPKLGLDDWLGALFEDFGGLGTLLVYDRTVPSAPITSDLWEAFRKSELAEANKSKSNFFNLQGFAITLSAMSGRLPTKAKTCYRGCVDEDGNNLQAPAPQGRGVQPLPNDIVAPPYSVLQMVHGIKDVSTIDTRLSDLISLGFMEELTNTDPRFKYNNKTGEMEIEKTRYFRILNPAHQPDDCDECQAYYLWEWDGFNQMLNGDETLVNFEVDPGDFYPEDTV